MKERIDHSNYEAWLLDRLEGNLTPQEEAMLDAFLLAYPGLEAHFEELPGVRSVGLEFDALDKEALKRSLPPIGMPSMPLDDHLIARLEGDLTKEQEEELNLYLLAHPEHQRDARIYANAKLLPQAVTFLGRKELKRDLPPSGALDAYSLNDHLVARLEGDLSPAKEAELAALLANDAEVQRQWRLMQLTRIPAVAVLFPDKDGLKKGAKVIAIGATRAAWVFRLRVAASVALVLGFAIWALLRTPATQIDNALVEEPRKETEIQLPAQQDDTADGLDEDSTLQADPKKERTPKQEERIDQATPVPETMRQGSSDLAQEPEGGRQAPDAVDPLQVRLPQVAGLAQMPSPKRGVEVSSPGLLPNEEENTVAERSGEGIPVGAFLAGVVREQVLDTEADDKRPLDGSDAVAALDKGLRVVAGQDAGLALERSASGRVDRFDLRLGRNLSISARR